MRTRTSYLFFRRLCRPLLLPALCLMALSLNTPRAAANDKVRVETRADLAMSRFGVNGQGVIVAILDRGIDWKNNDFRNADGTTRIAYIFDLTDDTGKNAAGNLYGVGTIYTRTQINTALANNTALTTRDAVGHGTTTTSIAAGSGRNSTNQKYRGMAPNADIIAVKVTSDGVPAHDNQPAEAAFYDPTRLPAAIDFVRAKATELGKPCVMLLNLGSVAGPTDGTSSLARKIDATVGPGKPGLIFVTGAGDDGGGLNRAGGVVSQGGSVQLRIQKGVAGSLFFDLWYPGTDRFNVTVQTPNATYGPYASPATNNDYNIQTTSDFLYYHLGANQDFNQATSNKRELWMRLDGPVGTYILTLQGATVSNGRFDATLNPASFTASTNRFLNFNTPGSIWDGATALYNICPNSYVIRTQWVDIDGFMRNLVNQGSVGELWKGSSTGPTFDGRLGIDVSAPGDRVVTTYNPTSYWATFRFNLINDGGGLYGMAGAVSAAAPATTGIIALMLQRNPQLDAAQIKTILQQTARSDAFTGKTPNINWGYGKIDAYAAIAFSGNKTVSGKITLEDCSNSAQPVTLTFRPTDGGPSFSRKITLNSNGTFTLTTLSTGNYMVAVKGEKWLQKVATVDARTGNVTNLNLTLATGDANNDNSVDVLDLDALIQAFDSDANAPNWNRGVADFNCDGSVDVFDLDLLIRNFDATGDD